jgi:hypothetical protein
LAWLNGGRTGAWKLGEALIGCIVEYFEETGAAAGFPSGEIPPLFKRRVQATPLLGPIVTRILLKAIDALAAARVG